MRKTGAPDRETGTVLLSTLLVLSLMSAVALALLATLRSSIIRTSTLEEQSQADLYARGALEFVTSQLALLSGAEETALNQQLAGSEPIILPFENGSIVMSVSDGTHCFRLSALSNITGTAQEAERLRFESLMVALGVDRNTASRISAASADWVDRDSQTLPGGAEDGTYLSRSLPHRTANVPMQSVTELRAVEGMSEELFRRLLPHLCIGHTGTATKFNIDSAHLRHAPVLAAIMGGGREAERLAIELIETRPSGGYGNLETLLVAPSLQGYDNAAFTSEDIVFGPKRIVAETIIRFGSVERAQLLAFEGLDSSAPQLAYRAWGRNEFPSLAHARLAVEPAEEEVSR